MHSPNSQCNRILEHMKINGGITSLEAFEQYGCTRLASRICDLRREGHKITAKHEKSQNRYGESVIYCRYYLAE